MHEVSQVCQPAIAAHEFLPGAAYTQPCPGHALSCCDAWTAPFEAAALHSLPRAAPCATQGACTRASQGPILPALGPAVAGGPRLAGDPSLAGGPCHSAQTPVSAVGLALKLTGNSRGSHRAEAAAPRQAPGQGRRPRAAGDQSPHGSAGFQTGGSVCADALSPGTPAHRPAVNEITAERHANAEPSH